MVTAGCSRTAPESQWPPPGPADGLPVAPLPEKQEEAPPPSAEPPKPAAPSAVDAALPAAPPVPLEGAHQCKEKLCRFDLLPDVPPLKTAVRDDPGVLWVEEIAPKSAVTFARHQDVEVLGVVLSGKVAAAGDEGGAPLDLGVWGALRAPGAGLALTAGEQGAKLVLGMAARTGNLAEAAGKKPFAVRWKKRPGPLAHVALDRVEDLAWAAGAFHARIGFGNEGKIPGSLGVLRAAKDALIKEHDHPTWEHIVILEGHGTMRLSGKGFPVTAGSVFFIPPGKKHSFDPAGDQPLLAVQMYAPSGPEQRFVGLAKGENKAVPSPAPEK